MLPAFSKKQKGILRVLLHDVSHQLLQLHSLATSVVVSLFRGIMSCRRGSYTTLCIISFHCSFSAKGQHILLLLFDGDMYV